MSGYQKELHILYHRRIYHILIVGMCLTVLFSLLDYIVVPQLFNEFMLYRVGLVGFGLGLVYLNYRDTSHRHAAVIGFSGYLLVSLVVILMIYRMGGVTSPYYVGLIVAMTIYSSLAPLTFARAVSSGFIVVGIYLLAALTGSSSPLNILDMFTNLFFMVCFVFIIATQSWADTTARQREYQARMQEKAEAEQLADQAALLEKEVEKRSQEQAVVEERYKLLFNQIADDVVVLDETGAILQSNDNFNTHFSTDDSAGERSFWRFCILSQQQSLQEAVAEMIRTGKPLSAFQTILSRGDGSTFECEINGSLLVRQDKLDGILLIIRDISIRKEMENKLIRSLEIKKKTETAAILALAKLSEFRDVMAGNHLERVREYCRILATELASHANLAQIVTESYKEDLYHAAILHDIGKVAMPDDLLLKESLLQKGERERIRRHTVIGGDFIKEMEEESQGSGFLLMAKQIAYFHHERWDGAGYPYGLMKREIPLAARIMALADTYEELTAPGEHGVAPLLHEEAVLRIIKESGKRFDPLVVDAFQQAHLKFVDIRQQFSEDTDI